MTTIEKHPDGSGILSIFLNDCWHREPFGDVYELEILKYHHGINDNQLIWAMLY